jgi:hypothetical protein
MIILKRPFTIIGLIVAIHTIIVGFGLVFIDSVKHTPLYTYISQVASAQYLGIGMMVVGALLAVAYSASRGRAVNIFSQIQSMIWLFMFFGYVLGDSPFLGLQNALPWALISGYVEFAFRNRRVWVDNYSDSMIR